MKKKYLLILSLIIFRFLTTINGQTHIPNGNFENWSSVTYDNPQNYPYTSNNDAYMRGTAFNLVKSTDAYHGTYAIQISTVVSNNGPAIGYFLNANPNNGDPSTWTGGIPYNQSPTGLRGYFKYNVASADSATIILIFRKSGSAIGSYYYKIGGLHTTYTLFDINFSQLLPQTPDSVIFGFVSSDVFSGGNGVVGSTLLVDSISFKGVNNQPALFDGDFENWQQSQTPYTLINWNSNSNYNSDGVIRTTDALFGNYAVEIKTYLGQRNNQPSAQSGQISNGYYPQNCNGNCNEQGGIPFSNKIDTFAFYYKYVPANPLDFGSINLTFKKNGNQFDGRYIQLQATSGYQYMEIPFNLWQTPDTVIIDMQSSNWNDTLVSFVGASLKIDKIHFKTLLNSQYITANTQTWVEQNTLMAGTSTTVDQISIVDSNVVWVNGINGTGSGVKYKSMSHTNNGGTTWIPGTYNGLGANVFPYVLTGVSSTKAFCVALDTVTFAASFMKTTDSGNNWTTVTGVLNNPPTTFADGVKFWGNGKGFCYGDPVNNRFDIYRTNDSGSTWIHVDTTANPLILSGEYGFSSPTTASIVSGGIGFFFTNKGRVYKTTNYGVNWTLTPTAPFNSTYNGQNIYASSSDYILAGCFPTNTSAYLWKFTTNGGASWDTLHSNGPFYGYQLCYVPGTNNTFVSSAPYLASHGVSYSNNGGLNWTDFTDPLLQPNGGNQPCLGVGFVDASKGWLGVFSSSSNKILKCINSMEPVTPHIANVSPNTVSKGQTITVTITGVNTHFNQEYNSVWLSQGNSYYINSNSDTVISATVIKSVFYIDNSMPIGSYDVKLYNNTDGNLSLTNGLTIINTTPSVSTVNATNIGQTSANCSGNVFSDGGATILSRGICYDTMSAPDTSKLKVFSPGQQGYFMCTLSGLKINKLYHYRAFAINSIGITYGDDSTFTTLPFVGYCSAGSNNCDEYIANVNIGTINNSSMCSSGGYADYTAMSTNITKGTTLLLSINNGSPYPDDLCGVWVDWNNNGNFSDDQFINSQGSPGSGPYLTTIYCPLDAQLGQVRIRIRIHYNDEASSPCGNSQYGEVEDYSLNVIEPIGCPSLNYLATKAQSVAGTYTGLDTNGTVIQTANFDDANSAPQNIGFSFNYNCQSFTQFILNTNGFIKLGNTPPSSAGLFFDGAQTAGSGIFNSSDAADVNLISPFNHDLTAGSNTPEYRVNTSGMAPNRICTIQYKNVRDKTTTPAQQYNNMKFQIKLYETSNIIEFVYGDWTPSANPSAFKTSACGLKGSSNQYNHLLVVNKGSTATWDAVNFTNGNYNTTATLNFGNPTARPKPDIGRTYRFIPTFNNDLAVGEIYSLGEASSNYSSPQTVSVNIINTGYNSMSNIPVTLSLSGVNTFSDTQYINYLNSGGSTTVYFNSFMATSTGTTNITISLPNDDYNNDNSKMWVQNTNAFTCNYSSIANSSNSFGFIMQNDPTTSSSGIFYAKYHVNGTANVSSVKAFIANNSASIGQTVYAIVLDTYGNIVGQSGNYVIQTSDMGSWHTFSLNNQPSITNSDYYAGFALTIGSTPYYPMGVQNENPSRPSTFFTSNIDGSGLYQEDSYSFPFRFMIGTILSPIPPPFAGTASSNATICGGTSSIINLTGYTGSIQWQQSSNGTSNWTYVMSGIGANTNSYTTDNLNLTTYYRAEVTQSGYPSVYSNVITISINPLPANAGTITGAVSVCQGQSTVAYSVHSITNATSYIWTLPNGANGISTTNNITLNYGANATSGNISVKGHNMCGEGVSSNKAITVNPLPQTAGPIMGPISVQTGQNSLIYIVPPIPYAISYTWTLPSGYSGISMSNSITINISSSAVSGIIKVKGNNSCGDGIESSLNITVNNGNVVSPTKKLLLHAMLQGLYQDNGSMKQVSDFDPYSEDLVVKFQSPPYADTISIIVRNTEAPFYNILAEYHGLGLGVEGNIPLLALPTLDTTIKNVYVIFNHRNSIETWSDSINIIDSLTSYNFFSHSSSIQFANNMNPIYNNNIYLGSLIWSGEIFKDGVINIFDLSDIFDLINDPNSPLGYIVEDINGDGINDIFDLAIVFDNLNLGVGVINPFTLKKK